MQARSALFDLYGDYLRPRGGYAPVAALVRLLAPLQIAAPAVRTAVSRMVRQGWLRPVRLAGSPGYSLTPKAARRVDEAALRIYRSAAPQWSGSFDLVVVTPPASRAARSRLANNLAFLGYGQLPGATWIAPRPAAEVDSLLAESKVAADRFSATPAGGLPAATALVHRAWDLDELGAAYQKFVAELRPVAEPAPVSGDDEAAFVARFRLVHAWRSFLFRDPALPAELLPSPWPGALAAEFFQHHAGRLRPAADRYVDARLRDAERPGAAMNRSSVSTLTRGAQ